MTPAGMQGQDAYRISRVIGNNFVCITTRDGARGHPAWPWDRL